MSFSNLNSDTESNSSESDISVLYDPFNPSNNEITLKDIQCILKTHGLPSNVFNIALYKRAFVHSSYVIKSERENEENNVVLAEVPINCLPLKHKSNERLEFLGDGILEAITKFYLYKRFPKENEGFMTEKKIALVKNEAIGRIAFQMRLQKWFILSKSAEEKGMRTNVKKLGCLFEAFLGALFLDYNKLPINDEDNLFQNVFLCGPGFQMAQLFVESIFEKYVDWQELLQTDDNYKNILQVKIQKKFKTTPDYVDFDPNDKTTYLMGVFLCLNCKVYNQNPNDAIDISKFKSLDAIEEHMNTNPNTPLFILLGKAENKTKKKAEQIACKQAIDYLSKA
jgi:dsRNA-specific ribonuclease